MSVGAILVPFGLMGLVIGVLLAVLVKRKKPSSSSLPARDVESLSAEQLRNLAQLKSQLESGLVTKEEYREKRQNILNEL